MSEENTNVEILTRWQDPTIEELKDQLQQKEKEIQDLKQKNDYLNDLEASAVEYKELQNQLQQKENIIKEVREYCDREIGNIIAYFDYVDTKDLENIKKILDKEKENG